MEFNVQFVKMPTSETMEAFVIERLEKLANKYNWLIKAAVYYKFEKDPKGKGKICEIELSLNGPRIFASTNSKSFEEATDKTIKDLEKQLKKKKSSMKPYM